MQAYHYWIILCIILFIGEIFTPGFLLVCFGVGAFAGGLAAFFHAGLTLQLFWFCIVSLVVFFGIRPFILKFLHRFEGPTKIGIDALIGKEVIVEEKITVKQQLGRVKIGSESWKAKSVDGTDIDEKSVVIVTKIEGATAYVERKDKGE